MENLSLENKLTDQTPCLHQKLCPISKKQCPGLCVYAGIMDSDFLGIIIFDLSSKEVMFQNKCATRLLSDIITPYNFKELSTTFFPVKEDGSEPHYPACSKSIQVGIRTFGYSIYKNSDRFVWMIMRDITREVRLESIAEASTTMNNTGYIFSGIRHEIGNPLNTIKMTLSVLQQKLGSCSRETVEKYIFRVLNEVERIEYLLNSLKSFNLYENLDIQEIDLVTFMTKFLSLIKTDLNRKGISLYFSPEQPTIPALVDQRTLHQVLLNLIINASDALENQAEPKISISLVQVEERVFITVKDNGHGIPDELKKDLFKPFVTTKKKGTGLGLVFSRKMITKMNGTIEAESNDKEGTTMLITIPAGGISEGIP